MIVLTCGGPAPAALRPTSFCSRIDGVDWLATQNGKEVDPSASVSADLDFTTIGRSAYVVVHVPSTYRPAAEALVDLATVVKQHTTDLRPCR